MGEGGWAGPVETQETWISAGPAAMGYLVVQYILKQ